MTERTEETRDQAEQTAGTDAEATAEETDAAESETLPEHLQQIVDTVQGRYPDLEVRPKAHGWLEVNIEAEQAKEFFLFIKDTPQLAFDYLSDLTAVDYEEKGFQIVYHLIAVGTQAKNVGRKLVIKIDVPRENPRLTTAVDVWPTANFHEREVYDMFGVVFDGHPDLRRILMPEDWIGHPLRKDYVDERPPRPRVVKKQ